ncbi:hypothetical protein ACQEVM_34420 [Streptomyces sp. CA-243310]|uniref:hypothetical protein n=1 Tax=Streptomyces sp. CA-243310 TaxID=3240056 RepID=UPI003D8FB274
MPLGTRFAARLTGTGRAVAAGTHAGHGMSDQRMITLGELGDVLSVASAFMGRSRREAHHDHRGDAAVPWINAYVKSDGTRVSGHLRLPPGARRETALLGLIVAGVFILGNSPTTVGADAEPRQGLPGPQPQSQPRSQSTSVRPVYPIKWPAWENRPAPRPEPSVSYPIVFPDTASGR